MVWRYALLVSVLRYALLVSVLRYALLVSGLRYALLLSPRATRFTYGAIVVKAHLKSPLRRSAASRRSAPNRLHRS